MRITAARDPDFYMSESLRKSHGIHDIAAFKGREPAGQ
jgi:hypothetical protein